MKLFPLISTVAFLCFQGCDPEVFTVEESITDYFTGVILLEVSDMDERKKADVYSRIKEITGCSSDKAKDRLKHHLISNDRIDVFIDSVSAELNRL